MGTKCRPPDGHALNLNLAHPHRRQAWHDAQVPKPSVFPAWRRDDPRDRADGHKVGPATICIFIDGAFTRGDVESEHGWHVVVGRDATGVPCTVGAGDAWPGWAWCLVGMP